MTRALLMAGLLLPTAVLAQDAGSKVSVGKPAPDFTVTGIETASPVAALAGGGSWMRRPPVIRAYTDSTPGISSSRPTTLEGARFS